jgi:hypothetical protein
MAKKTVTKKVKPKKTATRKSAVHKYIEDERGKGSSDKDIQHKLLDAGWEMDIVQHVMEHKTAQKLESQNTIAASSPVQAKSTQFPKNLFSNPYFLGGALFVLAALLALFI